MVNKKEKVTIIIYEGGDEDDPSTLVNKDIIYDGGGEDDEESN